MGDDELALRIDQLGLADRLGLRPGKAVALVALRGFNRQSLGLLRMILPAMLAAAYVQPAHRLRINRPQPGGAFDAVAVTQMLTVRDRTFLRDLAVPQPRVLALTEFFPADPAAQKPDPVCLPYSFRTMRLSRPVWPYTSHS